MSDDQTIPEPASLFMSLDLEMNQPSRKIIQIGICIGNLQTGEILTTKDWIVNPEEELNPRIITLTGISEQEIKVRGVSMASAYEELTKLHRQYQCKSSAIVWGAGDIAELQSQSSAVDWPFGYRFFDIKTIWQWKRMQAGLPTQGGLAKSLNKAGLMFRGRKHDAEDDAINTFRLACLLMNGTKI